MPSRLSESRVFKANQEPNEGRILMVYHIFTGSAQHLDMTALLFYILKG